MGKKRKPARAPEAEQVEHGQPAAPAAESLSPQASYVMSLQQRGGNRAVRQLVQRNETGLPDDLKSGVESLSGVSLDDVRVHYDSSEPAQLDALAYTQGTDIHVAPGQEQHLPHEAWHVVQQAEGRVQPTSELQGGVAVNDDTGLEQEAEAMGSRAASAPAGAAPRAARQAVARSSPPVQRLLAHTSPIAHGDVVSVRQVGGKLVYILDGRPNNGIVVVKFEVFGNETLARYDDRSAALRTMAASMLQNVPGTAALTPADMQEIAQIPANVGGPDLAHLKMMAAGVLGNQQGFNNLLAMKMENINVGQNLEDMVAAANQAAQQAPVAAVAGPPAALGRGGRVRGHGAGPAAPPPVIAPQSPVWQEFGRMAAFDILVSNNDRFKPDGVNLQNVDMRGQQGVSLDVVDPNSRLDRPFPWEGEPIFRAPATWAQDVVGEMCDKLHIPGMYFQVVLGDFLTGFNAGKQFLKGQEANYRARGPQLGGRGQAQARSHTYGVIAARLHKI
jgi:hypothetical protein